MNTQLVSQHDKLSRFLFEEVSVRGELVSLNKTYQAILDNHDYPQPIKMLLGELLVATSLLTATLKFEGDITIQLQGDGPLNLAVINGNNHQQMRGVARVNGEIAENSSLKEMIGNGYIVITISPKQGERYQGIVGLESETLTGCIENYFMQSEQLPTKLFIHVGEQQGSMMAAGMLLQVLPAEDRQEDAFEHLITLTETVKSEELFTLSAEEVLYRLYHQEHVRLFDDQPVEFKCSCSRERCEASLMTLPAAEIDQILAEDGNIDMHCDYCNNHYIFDQMDIAELRQTSHSETVH
ncbi:Hsp33 family molecular chaperone HslO [Utexia brackfieldae]|uniref:Hsp33 family molecular chaperone HslO n=1 Tax=Utexia brackfieldae TaxID=3074108 RepID=UPI00370D6D15